MHMMMIQNQMDNERREQQYKYELDRREEAFQVHCEEMAMACEGASEQRQMMNLILMAMLNKNVGGNSNHRNPQPPSPSNTLDI